MKNKKLLFNLLAILLIIPAVVCIFLNRYSYTVGTGSSTSVISEYGLFADYSGVASILNLGNHFQAIWFTLCDIFMLATVILGLFYTIIFILELFGVKLGKNGNLVKKILACLTLAFAIMTTVFGILAFIICRVDIGESGFKAMDACWPFYLQMTAILGGVFAILANSEKNKKTAKKRK